MPDAKSTSMVWISGTAHREAGRTQILTRRLTWFSSQKIYKLPCCRSDRSHETKLNLQKHIKRKVWVWLFYFLCGNSRPVSKSRLCCNSLQDFAHIFCCAGNGIAAEHIVAVVFVVNENCPHVFAAQEKELLLNILLQSSLLLRVTLEKIWFTVERSLLFANSATTPVQTQVNSRDTCKPIQERSLFCKQCN